jgi:hypothetical protein
VVVMTTDRPILGIVDSLNGSIVENTRQPFRHKIAPRMQVEETTSPGDMSDTVEARHALVVWASARVTQAEWADENARRQIRQRAAQTIARHLLWGLDGKLQDALEALWEDGLHDHKAAKVIDEIREALRTGR